MQTEDGQVLQLSRSWTELTGYKLSDMHAFDNWVTNAVYDGADAVRNHMRELFKGNKNLINVEFTVRTHNRGIRNWSFSASSPGTLLDGRRFIIGMAVDITERKKAEEALKESEERFAKAFFHGPQAMTIADMEGRIIEANEHYAKLFGFNHEELVGHTMPELVKIGNPHVRDKHLKQLEDKGSVEGEQFYVLPSGKTIYTFYSSQKVTIKGKPRLLTTIQDVTERRKAEGEVARLASFPTLNTNPIIEADFEGKITYLNPAAKGTLDNIEARGSSHPFLVDWQNVIQTFKAKPESILSREVSVFDHWYLQTLQLVPETECIRVYSVDITERKKAEQALAKSEEQFRRAIEEAPIPVIMHAEDGAVLQLSRTWTDLTGYTINDVPNFDTWLTKAVYGEGANVS